MHECPKPRLRLLVRRESGPVTHSASIWDGWREWGRGSHPVDERGVRMEVRKDDGTKEWEALFTRAQASPIREG